MLGPGTVSMDCSLLSYLVVTLKPKRFNSFYCSICIPDNQTGSWPWGPWRSCRAVPHTHGCSGGKPHGGPQSWTPRCPGCCCPHWGSPHPLVRTLEGSRPVQGVEEEGAVRAFPILLRIHKNSCIEKSGTIWIYLHHNRWIFLHMKLLHTKECNFFSLNQLILIIKDQTLNVDLYSVSTKYVCAVLWLFSWSSIIRQAFFFFKIEVISSWEYLW